MRTYCQPLRVVLLIRREERAQRVVSGDPKAGNVGQELAAEVEDDKEEVEGDDADDGVGLGDAELLLEVVEGGVLGQLLDPGQVSTGPRDGAGEGTRFPGHTAGDGFKQQKKAHETSYLTVELPEVVLGAVLRGRHVCADAAGRESNPAITWLDKSEKKEKAISERVGARDLALRAAEARLCL